MLWLHCTCHGSSVEAETVQILMSAVLCPIASTIYEPLHAHLFNDTRRRYRPDVAVLHGAANRLESRFLSKPAMQFLSKYLNSIQVSKLYFSNGGNQCNILPNTTPTQMLLQVNTVATSTVHICACKRIAKSSRNNRSCQNNDKRRIALRKLAHCAFRHSNGTM